ncbi:MAG: 3-methyl-2-oxobutanoate hydroxymethyltransferase, partial [Gammaproteobacteria bacterium]|nr:3-methyl-2-oxobutanoate hydroxymethyltransferase [Gammaproteobacteria bacterium]
MSAQAKPSARLTVRKLNDMKAKGEKIACLTAYDASFAQVLDNNGVDAIL